MGLCTVCEPGAGHYYSWARAMPQLKGHVQVLGTFPSSPELWLSGLSCCLLGAHREFLGGHKRCLLKMCLGSAHCL